MRKQIPMTTDNDFMRLALTEAKRGVGLTSPNPVVGAVIISGGRVIGRGWHQAAGCPHAEIEAIAAVRGRRSLRDATLYVTLEPCSTTGRTPPCTIAIIDAGFARVVYGATDPNPRHAGRAKALLLQAGVKVTTGVLAEECEALNPAWNKWIATGLPFVTAKAGMSLDGRIAPVPGSKWITSTKSRADAMRLRATCDAVLVGGGTIRADNPRLTLRGFPGAVNPLRVVWTKSGRLPKTSRIFADRFSDRTRIFVGVSLRKCLKALAAEGVQSVLIEGGGRVLGEAFDKGLVDRVVFYIAPVVIGGPVPAVGGRGAGSIEEGWRLQNPEFFQVGPDLRVSGMVKRHKTAASSLFAWEGEAPAEP